MKNLLWGVLAIVLLVLGVWMFNSKNGPSVVDDGKNATSTEDVNTPSGTVSKVSFKSLLSQKGNFECNYEQVDPKFRSTNVVYLSNGKMRAEFRTASSTGSLANLMVYDGYYLYVWKEGMSTGVRTQPKSISELPDVIPADLTSAAVYGTSPINVSYDCHPWSTDPKLLVKPSYVTFK